MGKFEFETKTILALNIGRTFKIILNVVISDTIQENLCLLNIYFR